MTKYLVSFPGPAMNIPDADMAAVGEAARAVIREAKSAGVYVFGGGINEGVAPMMVASDGTITNETYPQTKELSGGFCVLELPSREAAIHWAAKIANACRCSQELREFGYAPESQPAGLQSVATEEVRLHHLSSSPCTYGMQRAQTSLDIREVHVSLKRDGHYCARPVAFRSLQLAGTYISNLIEKPRHENHR